MRAAWKVEGFGDVDDFWGDLLIDCLPRELGATGEAWSAERFDADGGRPLKAYPIGSPPIVLKDPDPVPEYWPLYNGNYAMEVNIQRKSGVDQYDWYRYSPRSEYNFEGEPAPPPGEWTPSLDSSGYSIAKVFGGPNNEVWYLDSTNIALWHGYLINAWFNREAPLPPSPLQPDPILWHLYNLVPGFWPNETNTDPTQPPTPRPVFPWTQAIINHESYGDQGPGENANGHHARCEVAGQAHFRPSYRPSMSCDAKEYLEKVVYWAENPGPSQFGMVICVLFTVKEDSAVENNLKTFAAGDMHDGIRKSNNLPPIGPDDPPVPLVVPNWPLVGHPNNYVYCVNFYGQGHWWHGFAGGGHL